MARSLPSQKANSVRIIGGRWRSRKIEFPPTNGLRPSGDRIRETLFNWLQTEVIGAHCLDLFAGSGILGIEALSRGAASCTFIDSEQKVCRSLQNQLTRLEVEQSEAAVVQTSALRWLKSAHTTVSYNIIFVDPPFSLDIVSNCCELLEASELLSSNASIYVETARDQSGVVMPPNWQQIRAKSSGQVSYSLYRRETL